MIPDKIYVGIVDLGNGYATDVCLSPREGDYDEYIRKDALLKWAKEWREVVAKEVVIQEGVRLGADAAFEELIYKLNEM